MSQPPISLTPDELETLIRRVVREELIRLLRTPTQSILDDWQQEGPDDAIEDERLLHEALARLHAYGDKPGIWKTWEDFEAELDSAEAAGELPD